MRCRSRALAALCLIGSALAACSDDHGHGEAGITFTVSGENAALNGFSFPPASADDPAVVDGWEIRYERVLVTVGGITLSENPDTSPTDQSQVGNVVAEARGPWAIDLTKAGSPGDVETQAVIRPLGPGHSHGGPPASGRGSAEDRSIRLVRIDKQNRNGGAAFDPTRRYAFGYDVVTATNDARKVNFDAAAEADYATMVQEGVSMLYVGTATFKGGTNCRSSDASYDFTTLPTTVRFRFAFKTPAQFINCQNTDLTGQAFDGEEAQRGIQIREGAETFAQLTFHTDHAFWNTVDHDAAQMYFDQIAAFAKPDGSVTLEDLAAADFTAFKDKAGTSMPWRSCLPQVTPRSGARSFDPGAVRVDPSAAAGTALRHYGDYLSYVQSTQAHLNADGLCAVRRNYPSPQ
jgi:hypothetical protein